MAPPEKRAVAPGEQPVRVDNVKDKSWVDVNKVESLRGQIFFATNDATLDNDDLAQLDVLHKAYNDDMVLNPTSEYKFQFYGYADHRHTDMWKDNEELSKQRASAVEQYLYGYFASSPKYTTQVVGLGVDKADPKRSEDSKSLAHYRRVDIIGPPLRGLPPPEPDPPPPPRAAPILSSHWQARMKSSGSLSGVIFQGDLFYLDVVDLEHNHILEFQYKGLGFGLSVAPVGGSYSKDPTPWQQFTTSVPVAIEEFEGFAFHVSGQAQGPPTGTGGTFDLVTLTLAHSRRDPDWVNLEFHGFTLLDPNLGLGGAVTGGSIVPTGEWLEWSPSDP